MNILQKIFDGDGGTFGGGQIFFAKVFGGEIFVGKIFGIEFREEEIIQLKIGETFKPLKESRLARDYNFIGVEAIKFVEKILFAVVAVIKRIKNFARRNIRARQRNFCAVLQNQHKIIVASVRQRIFGKNCAGRDDFS